MTSALIVIIYLSFISLGLPDSILGAAWPSMYGELNVSVSYAGIISMIIAGGTILSSLFSARLINRYSTGVITTVSVLMTAIALIGFSFSNSFYQLCLWSIPYGLGAGSVDAALNNFVALHYKSRHMNWLHCFWGVGATTGPFIMGLCLAGGLRWNSGYQIIGAIQTLLVLCLMASLPLWKRKISEGESLTHNSNVLSLKEAIRLPGVKPIISAFFFYCSLESTAGLWASSYMVLYKCINAETAAKWASLFYLGISAGRFISGFISDKLGDKKIIRLGQVVAIIGTALIIFSIWDIMLLLGLILLGLGCAPIYPGLIHETPVKFGADKSQSIIGIQMASAYVGTTFMSPVFGVIAEKISISLYPFYMMIFILLMIILVEKANRTQRQ